MANNFYFIILSIFIFITSNIIGLFKNPIHSLLSFFIIILLIAFALLSLKIYYLTMTLIIIYAGAVIILFLFLIITVTKNFKLSFDYKISMPNLNLSFFFLIINLIFSQIVNNINFPFLHLSYDPLDNFLYHIKYDSNDIAIFSENLFSEHFLLLTLIVFILLLLLISSIIIAKKSNYAATALDINTTSSISQT